MHDIIKSEKDQKQKIRKWGGWISMQKCADTRMNGMKNSGKFSR